MVALKARKHLSADALFHLVRSGFAHIPEARDETVDISLTDTLMSAFAMFSLKAPSLLAFDKERAEGNLPTIYGIQHVPCDTYMRERLDPVSPKWLRPRVSKNPIFGANSLPGIWTSLPSPPSIPWPIDGVLRIEFVILR